MQEIQAEHSVVSVPHSLTHSLTSFFTYLRTYLMLIHIIEYAHIITTNDWQFGGPKMYADSKNVFTRDNDIALVNKA